MAQNLPSKIGKYEVLEILGQGGMGTVYKAVDPLIGRLVAIKVIVADYIDNPELLKRFYREAKAVGNLAHPNIVIVYDLGEENKNPYLVMEYLDGEPLNKIIARRQELPLIQKLAIIAKVCDALSYAHQRDIVHRDVKPANVLLLKDRQVKLLDFGIARLGNTGYNQTETRKGQVMGTMSYMSPEQLNEEIVDGRSDVYSTGVMLFELLTYRLPFEASDLASLIAKKMQGVPPPPLSKYIENYPPELDEVLARALAKDRDERHGSAQDLAFDLERLIERLKRDMVSHYVERAREFISSADLGKAKDLLSEVLKIDTQHTAAKQLLYEVQQSIQKQQRLEHIRQLQQHAREAIAQKQLDDASKFADEAIKLDDTDPDSLNLREHIQQARLRAQQIKKLLHLAEVAQQSGELGVFQRAVSDALDLDPEDPEARVLQASLIRLQAEQEKDAKVQGLLVATRRDIALRQFDAAQENILNIEALDPHRHDIPSLKQMVLAGQQQEARTRQLQEFCREIQQELEANNLRMARDLAEKALRAFPGEPALLRMKSAAESQIEAEQRRKYIEDQIAFASRWLEGGEPAKALVVIQEASRQFPTDPRLRDFLQMVRQAVQQDAVRRGQLAVLAQARDEMQHKRFAEAVEILEAGQIKYPDLRDISDLLGLARNELALSVKKKKIAVVSEQAQNLSAHCAFTDAIALLERTLSDTPDDSLEQLLQSARAQAAEFDQSLHLLMENAQALLDSGQSAEALMNLRSQATKFGRSPGFRALLERVEERVAQEQESRQLVTRVLEEARLYLRRGSLPEAEAALAECRAKAPGDPGVVAFESQLLEAKASAERESEVRPALEPQDPINAEPKTKAASPTVKFNPSAASTPLTPSRRAEGSPKDFDLGGKEPGAPIGEDIPEGTLSPTMLLGGASAEAAITPDQRLAEARRTGRIREGSSTPPHPQPKKNVEAVTVKFDPSAAVADLTPPGGTEVSPRDLSPEVLEAAPEVQATPERISSATELIGGVTAEPTIAPDQTLLEVQPSAPAPQKTPAPPPSAPSSDVKPQPRSRVRALAIGAVVLAIAVSAILIIPRLTTPKTYLKVHVNPGANVRVVDENVSGKASKDGDVSFTIAPGPHQVEVSLEGHKTETETVKVSAGEQHRLEINLPVIVPVEAPKAPLLSPPLGNLVVRSNYADADVYVGDEFKGRTGHNKQVEIQLPEGSYQVQVRKSGYDNTPEQTAKIMSKKDTLFLVKLSKSPGPVSEAPVDVVLSVRSNPGARVKVGDESRTVGPNGTVVFKLHPGTQSVQSALSGHKSFFGTVALKAGEQRNLDARLTPVANETRSTTSATEAPPSAVASVPATSTPALAATISTFAASPDTIQAGEQTKLIWKTENATSVTITPGIGKVEASGERILKPNRTMDYTLIASGAGGGADPRSVTITIKPEPSPPPSPAASSSGPSDEDGIRQARARWNNQYEATNPAHPKFVQDGCPPLPQIKGDSADWTCQEKMVLVVQGTRLTKTVNINYRFRKSDGTWHVEGDPTFTTK